MVVDRILGFLREAVAIAGMLLLFIAAAAGVVGYQMYGGLPSTKWVLAYQTNQTGCISAPGTRLDLDLNRQSVRSATSDRDGRIRAEGGVNFAGALQIGLTLPTEGNIELNGQLDRHYGSGTWRSASNCTGKWTAIDVRPINKWWLVEPVS
jgi:hypothetical protein